MVVRGHLQSPVESLLQAGVLNIRMTRCSLASGEAVLIFDYNQMEGN